VVLVNENTQSSAEVIASVLKKYNVGVLTGKSTRGWGIVEKVFEIENQLGTEEKYSMFLVHTLTTREDNLPIEGRGVEPVINMEDGGKNFSNTTLLPALSGQLKKLGTLPLFKSLF